MAHELTACFVGLGSIGRRHLKNLKAVCDERGIAVSIDALRHAPGDLPPDVWHLVRRSYLAADELPHYDVAFICNPSQVHYETLLALNAKADRLFVEKPVFVRPLADSRMEPFADERKHYVACPLRHSRTFASISEFVRKNRIYSVRALCSSYLPGWRPGQDYRQLYCARRESGGVALDLIHEFDYLFSLFGFPLQASLFARKVSALEIDSPDVVSFAAAYEGMTAEVHLDYFGRTPQRYCELFAENETARFDFLGASEDRNEGYLREMRYFLDFALDGRANINSVAFANKVLRIVMGGLA